MQASGHLLGSKARYILRVRLPRKGYQRIASLVIVLHQLPAQKARDDVRMRARAPPPPGRPPMNPALRSLTLDRAFVVPGPRGVTLGKAPAARGHTLGPFRGEETGGEIRALQTARLSVEEGGTLPPEA